MHFLFKTEVDKRVYLEKSLKRLYPTFQNGGRLYRDLISQHAKKHAIVLDAGCGNGGVLSSYTHLFSKTIGIDTNQHLLNEHDFLDEKILSDLSKIPLSDNSIDLVTCDFVLEHIQHPEEVFHEILRVLKPEGVFLFRTTNVFNPVMMFSKFLPLSVHKILRDVLLKKEEETHETYYRANSWMNLLSLGKQSGFKSIQLHRAGNPEYLAFSPLTVIPAILLEKCFNLSGFHWLKMYLIGVYKK
ncbi:hypothetical protein A2318_04195 [Candidatus Uhrbacteria bacterium RIFOXYB2_FULL_45_11]|uniref:Methyltransferase type 11 domain-containing protein n=1 Tax=Candidatus Uhrbacteria bacterium RIFOXYB2_FULL_45_11 TaxID=1802421 RepID=A0A1F7W493_9BACT|nr:MAG: hypothetical protein A2318_04195 [Candidatus Uhrbacteria bacterium RIFOXYB2_FULL_45_11]